MPDTRLVPIEPQPPERPRLNVEWYRPARTAPDGMMFDAPEIFGCYGWDWGRECPNPPGSLLNGQRVTAVSVVQHEGLWCWKIKTEGDDA